VKAAVWRTPPLSNAWGEPALLLPFDQGNLTDEYCCVCVKQIPDPTNPGRLDPGSHNLVRDGKLIMDDSDSYGVEMALQLVAKAGVGEVTLVSMAPGGEKTGLRNALVSSA
jgi:hypothetical protein